MKVCWYGIFILALSLQGVQLRQAVDEDELDWLVGSEEDCNDGYFLFLQESGSIASPLSGEEYYRPNCKWTAIITASRPIYLSFIRFSLLGGDSVKVSNVMLGGSFEEIYTMQNPPTGAEMNVSDSLQVVFTSNSDSQVGAGFKVSWQTRSNIPTTTMATLPADTIFRNVLQGTVDHVKSPNYPSQYPTSKQSHWVLSAAHGNRIKLIFKDFKISLDDFVEIYQGASSSDETLIRRLQGYEYQIKLPPTIVSSSNRVHIHFSSSPYVTYRGFSIQYMIYVPDVVTTTESSDTPKPLNPTVVAVICILAVLLVVIGFALWGYFFCYKPKRKAEEAAIAAELLYGKENPARPTTARPATARPSTAPQRPKTAGARPSTAAQRVGRPGTAAQRPTTAAQRPTTAAQRPTTDGQRLHRQRPRTAMERSGSRRPDPDYENSRSNRRTIITTRKPISFDEDPKEYNTNPKKNPIDLFSVSGTVSSNENQTRTATTSEQDKHLMQGNLWGEHDSNPRPTAPPSYEELPVIGQSQMKGRYLPSLTVNSEPVEKTRVKKKKKRKPAVQTQNVENIDVETKMSPTSVAPELLSIPRNESHPNVVPEQEVETPRPSSGRNSARSAFGETDQKARLDDIGISNYALELEMKKTSLSTESSVTQPRPRKETHKTKVNDIVSDEDEDWSV